MLLPLRRDPLAVRGLQIRSCPDHWGMSGARVQEQQVDKQLMPPQHHSAQATLGSEVWFSHLTELQRVQVLFAELHTQDLFPHLPWPSSQQSGSLAAL